MELVEVAHVVVDLVQPVFTGHPRRTDFARLGRHGRILEVEARQGLRRHDEAFPAPRARERLELPEEAGGELSVAVAHEPDVRHRWRAVTQGEVTGGARHCDVVLVHHVTRIVTISWGSAAKRTVLPRPSSTSGTASRSSARTRCALFAPSPSVHAPATCRCVAL
jgi:hypothetical protein